MEKVCISKNYKYNYYIENQADIIWAIDDILYKDYHILLKKDLTKIASKMLLYKYKRKK